MQISNSTLTPKFVQIFSVHLTILTKNKASPTSSFDFTRAIMKNSNVCFVCAQKCSSGRKFLHKDLKRGYGFSSNSCFSRVWRVNSCHLLEDRHKGSMAFFCGNIYSSGCAKKGGYCLQFFLHFQCASSAAGFAPVFSYALFSS